MSGRGRTRRSVAALLLALALLAASAAAADTQRVPLGQGGLSGPKASWKAIAVPPGSILIDYFDAGGTMVQTYGKSFGDLRPRGLDATGVRPQSLPSRHALVMGAAGSQVRKVTLHLRGGAERTLRTVPAPREWEQQNRLFAYGWTVPTRFAKAMAAVTEIEGLNAAGRTIATLRRVPTGAY